MKKDLDSLLPRRMLDERTWSSISYQIPEADVQQEHPVGEAWGKQALSMSLVECKATQFWWEAVKT